MTPAIEDAALRRLIEGILDRAARRGQGLICLALPFALDKRQVSLALADERVKGLVVPPVLDGVADDRIGAMDRPGDWRLPAGPFDTVYFAGSARALSVAMMREAARHGVKRVCCRVSHIWIDIPLDRIVRLKGTLNWLGGRGVDVREALGRRRGAMAGALARRWPRATPLARRLAGPSGLGGSPLEVAFRSLLAQAKPAEAPRPECVVLVCGSLSPGGAERQVAMTAAGLRAAGVPEVHLLCHTLAPGPPNHHDFHRARAESAGVRVAEIDRCYGSGRGACLPGWVRPPSGWLPDPLLVDIANLVEAFRTLRPSVVHAWLDWDSVRAGVAAAIAGVPRIVVSGRNLNPSNFVFHQPTMRPAYRALIDHPGVAFVNNSRAGADDYARWMGVEPSRIGVIANAVAFEGLDPPDPERERAARVRWDLPPEGPVIGGVFRFSPEKRPLLWLETAAELVRRRPDASFILFGMGPMAEEMRARATRLGLADRIRFAGVTKDIAEAMAAMDVVLLTSVAEGLPNVLIEAQALGRPVVTTKAGGAGEAINPGATGYQIDTSSPHPLADAVERILADASFRAQARLAGPAFVRAAFSVDRMVKQTMLVYQQS